MAPTPTLVLSVLLSLASAGLFLLVGRTVQVRPVSADARSANMAFVIWWYALGFTSLLTAFLAGLGATQLAAYLVSTIVAIALICIALWGLLYYLVFLYTNARKWMWPLAAAYAVLFLFVLYFIFLQRPIGMEQTELGARPVYENKITSGPLVWTFTLLIIGPQILAAIAYLTLYWKVDEPVLRRRILLVSLSILGWFGSSVAGTALQAQANVAWQLGSRLIGLVAAGVIYYAFAGLKPHTPHPASAVPVNKGGHETLGRTPPRLSRIGLPLGA